MCIKRSFSYLTQASPIKYRIIKHIELLIITINVFINLHMSIKRSFSYLTQDCSVRENMESNLRGVLNNLMQITTVNITERFQIVYARA